MVTKLEFFLLFLNNIYDIHHYYFSNIDLLTFNTLTKIIKNKTNFFVGNEIKNGEPILHEIYKIFKIFTYT